VVRIGLLSASALYSDDTVYTECVRCNYMGKAFAHKHSTPLAYRPSQDFWLGLSLSSSTLSLIIKLEVEYNVFHDFHASFVLCCQRCCENYPGPKEAFMRYTAHCRHLQIPPNNGLLRRGDGGKLPPLNLSRGRGNFHISGNSAIIFILQKFACDFPVIVNWT